MSSQVTPQSLLGKAVHYLANKWSRLGGVCRRWQLPIDKSLAKHAIKPVAIECKAWLFGDTPKAVKINRCESYAWLCQVLGRQSRPLNHSLRSIAVVKLLARNATGN
ncbi:IS66 family transposase [Pseudomonas sp. Marseille-P9899]|uniref:IS66 family transposase n=1 Tax=Pseudomonas sp. Marseille-P9899 TaxID=2730401 RepID=UPI00158DB0C6|nr:transposase [Pseudomonas sp. Marseille-P9899]